MKLNPIIREAQTKETKQRIVRVAGQEVAPEEMKVLGVDPDFHQCELCGKTPIKKAVVFDLGGQHLRVGTDCASRLLGAKNTQRNRDAVWGIAQAIEYIKDNLANFKEAKHRIEISRVPVKIEYVRKTGMIEFGTRVGDTDEIEEIGPYKPEQLGLTFEPVDAKAQLNKAMDTMMVMLRKGEPLDEVVGLINRSKVTMANAQVMTGGKMIKVTSGDKEVEFRIPPWYKEGQAFKPMF